MRNWTKAGEKFPCGYCGAQPGVACRSQSGRRARYQHFDRWLQVQEVAELSGYIDMWDRAAAAANGMFEVTRRARAQVSDHMTSPVHAAWVRARLDEITEQYTHPTA